ncbi:MAG TPA: ABC transporter ATP-binding protein [Spirochaetes bacterium]|nr:ABC transporter ATP-binding protein [Spirochaetota bacterium]
MIRVRDITRVFGPVTAVDALSFEVARGEIFGIVGPDGAGKSTLLRLMSGILFAGKGSIVIDGVDVRDDPYRIKEKLAYMPQRFGLYEDLTVEENIYFFGRLFGVPGREIRNRLPRLYEFSRLGPFKDRLAGKLSGGMKQKLGLACCLVHKPAVILLDEPTNGVDPVSRREFWKILYDLLGEGVTIVVSTAYLDEAERCNRVALMHEGKFIRTGAPAEIKGSVTGALLEIKSDDVWKAETLMKKSGRFRAVIREGEALRVFVPDGRRGAAAIRAMLVKKGLAVRSIGVKAPSLENCFMEIIAEGGAS